jgi:zinc transport system ATP-binding protein
MPPMSEHKKVAARFDAVGFSYGDQPVLEDASFHLHQGEFTALVGPNGAGKTTVLRLLLGLSKPASGRIEVLGMPPSAARDSVGYVPQHASFDPAFPITVVEVVRMGFLKGAFGRYRAADLRAAEGALETAGLGDLSKRHYSALSGGQRRRVLVARAMAASPSFLVLDEPTANMDAESEAGLYKALGELKGRVTVFMVTHDALFVSSLTDAVLCVGDPAEAGRGRDIVRHAAAAAEQAPPGLYGGSALRVLHDTHLPDDACCDADCQRRRKEGPK